MENIWLTHWTQTSLFLPHPPHSCVLVQELYIPVTENIFDSLTKPQVTSFLYPAEAFWHCVAAHTWIRHESSVGRTSVACGNNYRCTFHSMEPPSVLGVTLSACLSIGQFNTLIWLCACLCACVWFSVCGRSVFFVLFWFPWNFLSKICSFVSISCWSVLFLPHLVWG